MTSPTRGASGATLSLVFTAGLCLGAIALAVTVRASADPDVELMRAVRDLTAETYVDPVEPSHLVDDALTGMVGGLDRYSRYYGPDQIRELDRSTRGEFRGIGVVFRPPISAGQVLFAAPGSPAARAGMRVGDTITSLDGVTVASMEPGELQTHLQRSEPGALAIEVRGLDGEERSLSVVPEPVLDPTVREVRMADPERGLGYVALVAFSNHTIEEVDRAIEHLGVAGLHGLVLDLRGNGGGTVDAAVAVANRFVAEGRIVATRTRTRIQVVNARPSEARHQGLPLVLLVDGESASASEILAGALQDHGAAVLVGEPTYGKGTVQTLTRFGQDRAIVKLTTAHYLTPAWRRIERNEADPEGTGIAPDVLVPVEPATRTLLHRYLLRYPPPDELVPAIRAWESESGLELLPPHPADPQLDAALALLRGEAPADAPAEVVGR